MIDYDVILSGVVVLTNIFNINILIVLTINMQFQIAIPFNIARDVLHVYIA